MKNYVARAIADIQSASDKLALVVPEPARARSRKVRGVTDDYELIEALRAAGIHKVAEELQKRREEEWARLGPSSTPKKRARPRTRPARAEGELKVTNITKDGITTSLVLLSF
jgi:hypothetical protein